MTKELQEMRDTLAREVMGWYETRELGIGNALGPIHYFHNNFFVTDKEDWKPDQNIDQAMMVLEKFEWWEIEANGEEFLCRVFGTSKVHAYLATEMDLKLAICKAAIKTLERKDEVEREREKDKRKRDEQRKDV